MNSWKFLLKQNITTAKQLLNLIKLNKNLLNKIFVNDQFPLNIPIRLAKKLDLPIQKNPIFNQFIPTKQELEINSNFTKDPLQESFFKKENNLLYKYKSRALLLTTNACCMNCRFCFRKFSSSKNFDCYFTKELSFIKNDKTICEVILSGGDPLSLSNDILEYLINKISLINHVKLLRIHTRFPIGIPERIDEDLLRILSSAKIKTIFVLHINHHIELDEEVASSIKKLQNNNILVFSQSVLLKDVNDDLETLKQFYEKLIQNNIIPYYLHQLDPVHGAFHFKVSEQKGIKLIEELRKQLPGYMIPRYVKEIPKEKFKTIIT